jgi:hypothetical protein
MRQVVFGAVLAAMATAASPAGAQTLSWQDRGYVNLNLLIQTAPGDTDMNGTFELYEETGTFRAPWDLSGGPAFDLSGGWKVWRNLAVGFGFSHFSDSAPVVVTAQIPDPLVFDQFHERSIAAGDLDHSQTGWHLSGVWVWPVTDKIDVALSAGPSFFRVKADTIIGIDVVPNTVEPTGVALASESDTGVGGHFGVDVTYLLWPKVAKLPGTPSIGAGVLLRYAGASVELPSLPSLDVGGFQAGVGVRVRF